MGVGVGGAGGWGGSDRTSWAATGWGSEGGDHKTITLHPDRHQTISEVHSGQQHTTVLTRCEVQRAGSVPASTSWCHAEFITQMTGECQNNT